jgi:hypothetical protein
MASSAEGGRQLIDDSVLMYFDAGNPRSCTMSSDGIVTAPLVDLSKSRGNAIPVNSPPFATQWNNVNGTIVRNTISFNGSNQYFNVSANQLNVPYYGKTIMCVAQMATNFTTNLFGDPNYGFRAMFGKPDSNIGPLLGRNWNFYVMFDTGSSVWRYHWSTGSGYVSNPLALGNGVWLCGAVTHDLTGVVKFYHNGVNCGTFDYGQPSTFQQYINDPASQERIGALASGPRNNTGAFWRGNISSVILYNRVLSADEIMNNYMVYKSRFHLP